MRGDSLPDKLRQDIEDTKAHIEKGNKRIKSWYWDGFDRPEDTRELDRAPDESLLLDAAKYVALAAGRLTDSRQRLSDAEYDAELMMYGVAFERIASAVHLRVEPDEFLEKLDADGQTPSFYSSRKVMEDDLASELDDEQQEALKLTLDIVRVHRNNEAHLGYHQFRSYLLSLILLDVGESLLTYYVEGEMAELDLIRENLEEKREFNPQDWHEVEFDPDGRLG